MKTRPHKIQLAALILAIASMAPAIFPSIRSGVELPVMQGRGDYPEEHTGALAASAVYKARRPMPLSFETNRGQAQADVKFVGRGDGFALLLKPNEAVLSLHKRRQALAGGAAAASLNDESLASHLLSMKLEGANSTPLISGEEQQQVRANYFIGNDPAKWLRDVETFSRVSYSGLYRG
ncbi:MAG TPA: hypothetical protein VK651_08090, partial [Blastocatellia bacterium]|nr:hypothetical protein [Blastocatellia bacterium]